MKRKILSLILSISLIFSNQSINCFAETYGNETIAEKFNQTLNNTFNDPNFLKEQITKAFILQKIIKFGGYIAITVLSGFLGYAILRIIREQKYQARNYLNTIIEGKDSTINTAMSYLDDSELKNVVSNTVNTVVNSAIDTLHKKDIVEKLELKDLTFNTVNTVVNSAMDALHKKDFDTLKANLNTLNNMGNLDMNVFQQKYTAREFKLYNLLGEALRNNDKYEIIVKKLKEEKNALSQELSKTQKQLLNFMGYDLKKD